MPKSKVQLPEGVRDIISEEAYAKRCTEQRARDMFLRCGYQEIETPTFEYASVFDSELGDLRMENMVHFFDADGRMLTMRPDFTLPCARLVSALRDSFPIPVRVFYIGNAFGLEHNTGRTRREFSQAGAELMGLQGAQADAEIILTAVQVLENTGLRSFILDIGHVGVFEALWKEAGLTRLQADSLRSLLDQKNTVEAKDWMDRSRISEPLQKQFLLLIDLYGGMEVLQSAQEMLTAKGCSEILLELKKICDLLAECGLSERISIDLGHLTNMDYYTGTVFRAMADGVGSPLLSGGRYDNVLAQFSRPMPATGFALSISHVLTALENAMAWERRPPVSLFIGSTQEDAGKALCIAAQRRKQGEVVLTIQCATKQAFVDKQKESGAKAALWIDKDGTMQCLEENR